MYIVEPLVRFFRRIFSIMMPQFQIFNRHKRIRTEDDKGVGAHSSDIETGPKKTDSSTRREDAVVQFPQYARMLYEIGQKQNKLLDRYEVSKPLGAGSFGLVLKVKDTNNGKNYALKMSVDDYGKEENMKEVNVLKKFKDTSCEKYHIVQMFESFWWEGRYCIQFELLEMNLWTYLSKFPQGLPEEQTIKIFYQLLESLDYLRRRKIIHGDLKPQNVMIKDTSSLEIKVIDFGSAETTKTVKAIIYFQTRLYRAPEVFLGAPVLSVAVDMWSLGILIGELHTGTPLFQGNDAIAQVNEMVETLGMPPAEMVKKSSNWEKYFYKARREEETVYKPLPTEEGNWNGPGSKPLAQRLKKTHQDLEGKNISADNKEDALINLICQMLVYDPVNRIKTMTAMEHELFSNGGPPRNLNETNESSESNK